MSNGEPKRIRRRYKAQFMSKRWKEEKLEDIRHHSKRYIRGGIVAGAALLAVIGGIAIHNSKGNATKVEAEEEGVLAQQIAAEVGAPTDSIIATGRDITIPLKYDFVEDENTQSFGGGVNSQFGILIDLDTNQVVASRAPETKMYPASMTKVLTVLVAAEHLDESQLDDVATVTFDTTNYSYINECSVVGFEVDEQVKIRDLFYGVILCSGADASVTLAEYVAGSHEAFVDMMNEKLEQLGISETTHFTNCVGLYDDNHYSTMYDMAMIMHAGIDNKMCREVLNAHTYTTSPTEQHPEGITVSNWFLRRIEDKDTHGEVLCAKTGYVDQSGNCAASYSRK